MARYWIGGTGNWTDTAHWSASSGGAGGETVPTSSDAVIFDASSFSADSQTCTIPTATTAACLSFTSSAVDQTVSLLFATSTSILNIYGNFTNSSNMTIDFSGATYGTINIKATSTLINEGLLRRTNLYIDMTNSADFATVGGTFEYTATTGGTFEVKQGGFDTAGYDIILGNVIFSTSNVRTVYLRDSVVQLGSNIGEIWTVTNTTNLTFDAGTSTLSTKYVTPDFRGGGLSYYNLTRVEHLSNDPWEIYGDNTFNKLTTFAGDEIQFQAGSTQTVTDLDINGNGSDLTLIRSVTGGSKHYLKSPNYQLHLDYLDIQDSSANSILWYAGDNSTDSGNNEGWFFERNIDFIARSPARSVNSSLLVSWKKDFNSTIRLFTIGVSTIQGNDIIAPSEQIDSQWNKYLYFNESQYLLALDWEQGLNMPIGGINQGMASGMLDNTTGRFTPRYLGGTSELFTAILPRRPFIINAGFSESEVELSESQFVGLFTKQPEVDLRDRTLGFSGADFINFLGNRYVDNTAMYTGQRSDQLIENILGDLGYTTGQYELDYGINTIPFAIFNKGENFRDIINKITQAENAHFYQDNEGILRFENRQHWDNDATPDYDIFTSQVIDAKAPDTDHIINVVEIRADIREKQPLQTVFSLPVLTSITVPANSSIDQFFAFEDPVLQLTDPTSGGANSFYLANSAEDGSGTDTTSSLTVTNLGTFAEAVKYRLANSASSDIYITQFTLSARVAKNTRSLYYRAQDDSSVTAFEERPLVVENPYIHEESWAASFAQMILNDYAEPENLQEITIMAIPGLRVSQLVSWQGRYWRVFNKRTRLDPSVGFVQDLLLLKRTVTSYFRIGISLIGSGDKIAP